MLLSLKYPYWLILLISQNLMFGGVQSLGNLNCRLRDVQSLSTWNCTFGIDDGCRSLNRRVAWCLKLRVQRRWRRPIAWFPRNCMVAEIAGSATATPYHYKPKIAGSAARSSTLAAIRSNPSCHLSAIPGYCSLPAYCWPCSCKSVIYCSWLQIAFLGKQFM